ncbi:hypothetical protein AY601_3211 [Pedobacter cryoconitis]|uniref:Uncharacterized protein n=1 Tax=Pedobacter cryoconitis TaxID=188932 RepID=A0A127VFS0_9SPHI|nr:hypothetical protein AY601_3211 [Pedobacter cryoconitis]
MRCVRYSMMIIILLASRLTAGRLVSEIIIFIMARSYKQNGEGMITGQGSMIQWLEDGMWLTKCLNLIANTRLTTIRETIQ